MQTGSRQAAAVSAEQLVVRRYVFAGTPGVFVFSRLNQARYLLEGSALDFFEVYLAERRVGSDWASSRDAGAEGLRSLAAHHGLSPEILQEDYAQFRGELDLAFSGRRADSCDSITLINQLHERGIVPRVQLELLYNCNHRCDHCYIDFDDTLLGVSTSSAFYEHLPVDEGARKKVTFDIEETIGRLKDLGCVDLLVTGGEISLLKGLLPMLQRLSDEFHVELITNGSTWKEEAAQELARTRVSLVTTTLFSLDSEVHDAVTSKPGSLDKTLTFLDTLREAGQAVRVNVPILAANAKSIPGLVDSMRSQGIAVQTDYKLNPVETGMDYQASYDDISTLIEAGYADAMHRVGCRPIKSKARVDPFGDIYPCEYIPEKVGNLFEADTKASLRESALSDYLCSSDPENFPVDSSCGSCSIRSNCFTCKGIAYLQNERYDRKSQYLCDLNHQFNELATDETRAKSNERRAKVKGHKRLQLV